MVYLCPPAQVCLLVVKHSDGTGPALCREAPGTVSSGCPAGGAPRAAWWGERGAKEEEVCALGSWSQCRSGGGTAEPEQETWHHPLAHFPSVGQPVQIIWCGTVMQRGLSVAGYPR